MDSERETRARIEELRQRLHRQVSGPLTPHQLQGLLPISQEIDRLAVDFIRRRWQQTAVKQAQRK
ncbi:hypothetical protein [Symbiobacterium thermophilum]|uniref:Spo0E like sporulation regulatory protein n=2 Tax=Symbiobacterium thermophilum TaxID=2734 RepID=Q67P74_SYMTH|nr:hypothetical protein [Symbiobacterium thermophilum]MBY6276932.1 hypothetical protein [Symbiobacterium thermophilum]OTA40571.1 MAG: hypothetical protein A6D92_15740 [Symbiobacterium thermophilum]BAD40519.1 hypothetical protein STH1534 [Symbiobacterium thermophilum IAM 14863]